MTCPQAIYTVIQYTISDIILLIVLLIVCEGTIIYSLAKHACLKLLSNSQPSSLPALPELDFVFTQNHNKNTNKKQGTRAGHGTGKKQADLA